MCNAGEIRYGMDAMFTTVANCGIIEAEVTAVIKRELALQKQKFDSAPETQDQTTLALSRPSPLPATAGLTSSVFPPNFTPIFPLRQNLVSLTFNATKSQPRNPRVWKRLRRIFAMLTKERKDALREFLRLSDKIGKEVVIQPKVQRLQENLAGEKKRQRKSTEKPPPNLNSAAWLLGVIHAFRRAPNNAALRCVGG
jgi:hypothetical protein